MKIISQSSRIRLYFFLKLLFVSIVFPGCSQYDDDYVPSFQDVGTVKGYRPIYAPPQESEGIAILPPRQLEQPGKIYVYGDYLFVNELSKGVHIIDNSNPSEPSPVSFISIAGNVDIAIKDDVLYADNANDLVALSISNLNDIQLIKRIENIYPSQVSMPPRTGTYFECPDSAKGQVVGWESATLHNPRCYR